MLRQNYEALERNELILRCINYPTWCKIGHIQWFIILMLQI
jgi:hypothetical protein